MCFACETIDLAGFRPNAAIIARARRLDARQPGRIVSDLTWAVLAGEQQDHVGWPELRRAMTVLEKAENDLCARLRCDPVDPATAR